MSHNVETMMYAGAIPWHGLGVAVPHNVPWIDALRVAGLEWTVSLRDVAAVLPDGSHRLVENARAIVRDSDGSPFAVATRRYSLIQNAHAFGLFGELFGDAAVLHTAGSLRGGRIVWGLAELPDSYTVAGDAHRRFLLCTTRHDGSGALQAFPCATRVVCNNTLNLALGEGLAGGIYVRHTGDVAAKIVDAAATLARLADHFATYKVVAETLAGIQVAANDRDELVRKILPGETPKADAMRAKILRLADYGRGQTVANRGTAYALLQGVTEYADSERHLRSDAGKRFEYQVLGGGATMKDRALDLLAARYCVAA